MVYCSYQMTSSTGEIILQPTISNKKTKSDKILRKLFIEKFECRESRSFTKCFQS